MRNAWACFLFWILVLMGCYSTSNPVQSPNVLLILTDDQGWGDLNVHGNDSIYTPNLDALAQGSSQFEHFYVSPVCAPTRASLLTGRYHLRTGTSWVTHRKEVMRGEELTIAEVFRAAGYRTGCFGKWHNGAQYPNDPNGQGFEEFAGFTAGHWNNYFDTQLQHNDQQIKTKGYISDVLTDYAIDFIQTNKDNPFFCYLPFNAPHSPFQVPDSYFNKYKLKGLSDKNASVYGMVENIDDNLERLMQTLDSLKILENTIVVFLTDNGPNGHRYNGGMRGIKGKVHEGGVRVPCFIYWKGKLKAKKIEPLAAHIDLMPTLAELCDLPLPENLKLDGRSLVPLMQRTSESWEERALFTIHTEGENRMKPGAVRTNQYRLVVDHGGKKHLFDMKADPGETNNIASEKPELVDSLHNKFVRWYEEVTENGINSPPIPVGYKARPTVELPAAEATLEQGLQFKGDRGWANDYIINWKEKGDAASWELNVVNEGNYELVLQYNCAETFLNTALELEVNGKTTPFTVRKVFDFPFKESPDRVVRGEVYEKKWGQLALTPVNLPKGKVTLRIVLAQHPMANSWFELSALELNRLQD